MLTVDEAIRISRILASAPEERIPMILSVLEKADLEIGGLDELEDWKIYKDMTAVVDLEEFIRDVFETFADAEYEGGRRIPATEFSEFCKSRKLKPTPVKRALAKKGWLRTNSEGSKTNYTEQAWIDGKVVRCVVILKESEK